MQKIKIFYKGNPAQTEEEFNTWMAEQPPKEVVSINTAAAVAAATDQFTRMMRQVNTYILTVLYKETNFEVGPMSSESLSAVTGLPPRLTEGVLFELERRGVIDIVDKNTGRRVDINGS